MLASRPGTRTLRMPSLLLAGCLLASGLGAAAAPTLAADDEDGGHLVVADTQAATLYVTTIPDGEVVATFPDVVVGDHAGFLGLPGGRVLLTTVGDTPELLALDVDADGASIAHRIELPAQAIHLSIDPSMRHVAVSGLTGDAADGDDLMTVVDLATWTSVTQPVEAGEPGVIMTDDLLLHRNDDPGQLEAYPLAEVLRGQGTMSSSVPIGAAGHGEAYSAARGQAYVATDDGIDVVDVSTPALAHVRTLGWDADGRTGGRAYYLRIATDGDSLVSYVTDRSADAWGDWRTDAYLADLASNEVHRVPLGDGLVYRAGIGDGYALFFNQVPVEDPAGDHAQLIDLDPASATYGTVVASIALDPLSGQGTADVSIWDAGEGRIAAMTPDGRYGFVTNGGDGTISVIDTATRAISSRMTLPTPLSGGGYLVAVQPDMALVDNIGK